MIQELENDEKHDKGIVLGMNYSVVRPLLKDKEPISKHVKVSNQQGKWDNN